MRLVSLALIHIVFPSVLYAQSIPGVSGESKIVPPKQPTEPLVVEEPKQEPVAEESKPEEIKWHSKAFYATQESREKDKPILMFCTATDCGPCHYLEGMLDSLYASGALDELLSQFVLLRDSSSSVNNPSKTAIWISGKDIYGNPIRPKFPTIAISDSYAAPADQRLITRRRKGFADEQEAIYRLQLGLAWAYRPDRPTAKK